MKNILIYNSGGGLGDSIQLFDLATKKKSNVYIHGRNDDVINIRAYVKANAEKFK